MKENRKLFTEISVDVFLNVLRNPNTNVRDNDLAILSVFHARAILKEMAAVLNENSTH